MYSFAEDIPGCETLSDQLIGGDKTPWRPKGVLLIPRDLNKRIVTRMPCNLSFL